MTVPVRLPGEGTLKQLIARRMILLVVAALWIATPFHSSAFAQTRIVVGFAAGSGIDILTRIVAAKMQETTGEIFIVENRPGAGGRIAAQTVVNANPDGSTILSAPLVTTAFTPFMYKKVGYDALRDLAPITRFGNFKFALAVNNDVPARSVKDFVSYAKDNANKLGYSTPGIGTPAHFLGAMFNRATGTDLLHVPYKGSGPATTALLSGEVLSSFNTTVALAPMHESQQVRILAVTGTKRSPTLPNVPTLGESKMNLGEIESAEFWYGFFAPGKTPPGVIEKLNQAIVASLMDPHIRSKIEGLDIEIVTDTPEAFAKIVKDDYSRWGEVIRSSGFKILD